MEEIRNCVASDDNFDLFLSNLMEVFGEKDYQDSDTSESFHGIKMRTLPITIRKRLLYKTGG